MNIEIWKDFYNYRVSSNGKIYSKNKNKLMKPFTDKDGYKRITLKTNGKMQKFYIHRLVLEVFKGKNEFKNICNHINKIRNDNRLINLEWVTNKENTSKEKGDSYKGLEIGRNKPKTNKRKILIYDKNNKFIKECESITKATEYAGSSMSAIIDCCAGRIKSSKNNIYKYKII